MDDYDEAIATLDEMHAACEIDDVAHARRLDALRREQARRSRRPAVLTLAAAGGLIALLVVAFAIFALQEPGRPVSPPTSARPAPVVHTVIYQVEGEGTAQLTLTTPDGQTQMSADLPVVNNAGTTGLRFEGFGPGDFVYISAQNQRGYGSVTCRITVDGTVISENTATGGYSIATCKGTV